MPDFIRKGRVIPHHFWWIRTNERIATFIGATHHSSFCPISFRWYSLGLPWQWRVTENQGLIPEKGPEKWPLLLRKAAGAQITQSQFEEVVTINNDVVSARDWQSEWGWSKSPTEKPLEGKSGASSRGNSSSNSVY